ncbi:Hemophore HasA [Yersinia aldovae ATCC 35236]|uniref:Hemophore HasA n=2 Tax=Yersinia aldovae TaxID=29483 RepID=A0A0T9ULS1_YERAL|nr:Hemophore HasA [Yersinia aldovae ATCC 35236]CNH87353.1 hemophore HasA [Yersinia aldovae]CNK00547.1 hemophore HasA [Yersinia aldovae]CNL51727.1 hemophore HasA [Yersinia aldovae]
MMTVNSNMMTVSIKYNSQYADDTLTSYTQQWAARNGDIREAQDKGFVKQYGDFFGGLGFNGTQYAVISSHQTGTAMVVTGDLHYSFMFDHTFYGKITSLQLGESLSDNPEGGKQLDQVEVEFVGLDITGEYNSAQTKEQNHQGDMHKTTYGLMCGNPTPFLEILQAKGIEVNTPLKDMAIASQFEVMASDAPMIDIVGIAESSYMLTPIAA